MQKLSEIIEHSVESIVDEDRQGRSDEQLWNSTLSFNSFQAEELGVRVLRWDQNGARPPKEIIDQLVWRRYEHGLTVEYRGQEWVVLDIERNFGSNTFDLDYGDLIPPDAMFSWLSIARVKDVEVDI